MYISLGQKFIRRFQSVQLLANFYHFLISRRRLQTMIFRIYIILCDILMLKNFSLRRTFFVLKINMVWSVEILKMKMRMFCLESTANVGSVFPQIEIKTFTWLSFHICFNEFYVKTRLTFDDSSIFRSKQKR